MSCSKRLRVQLLFCALLVVSANIISAQRDDMLTSGDGSGEPDKDNTVTPNRCEPIDEGIVSFVDANVETIVQQGIQLREAVSQYTRDKELTVTMKELCHMIVLYNFDNIYRISVCIDALKPHSMNVSYPDLDQEACLDNGIADKLLEIAANITREYKYMYRSLYRTTKQTTKATTHGTTEETTHLTTTAPTPTADIRTCPTCPTCVTSSRTPEVTSQTSKPTSKYMSTDGSVTGSPPTSSSGSDDPESDKIQGRCSESQGLRQENVIIVGVTSFLGGALVVLLVIGLCHARRTSKLCFKKDGNRPERVSSERVTTKVLAKHMATERKQTPTVSNAVYIKGGPAAQKDLDGDNETPDYQYIDVEHMKAGPDIYTGLDTAEVRLAVNSTPANEDEHVYNKLEQNVNTGHPGGNFGLLRPSDKLDSQLFDRARESNVSNVSGHDYFVLQNENFRNSQPAVEAGAGIVQGVGQTGAPENTYFVLEK